MSWADRVEDRRIKWAIENGANTKKEIKIKTGVPIKFINKSLKRLKKVIK